MRAAWVLDCRPLAWALLLGACGARSALEPGEGELGRAGSPSGSGGGFQHLPDAGSAGAGGSSSAGGKATGGNATGGKATSGDAGMAALGGEGGSGGDEPCVPSGAEVCNGLDDDCDGDIDEDLPLEVAEGPIVVRSTEGRTDVGIPFNCDSCGWAWDPQLIAPGDQLAVVWFLGMWGDREQPSTFGRRLSWELEPQAEVSSLGPQYWLDTLRRGDSGLSGTLLTFVERVPGQDLPSFGFVDGDLKTSSSVALEGCPEDGLAYTLTPLFPGLISCSDADLLRLYAIDADRPVVLSKHQHSVQLAGGSGDAAGRAVAALRGEQALLAVPVARGPLADPDVLLTLRISPNGEALAEPLRLPLDLPQTLELDGLFATPSGYLLFGADRSYNGWRSGRFVAPLDPQGELAGDIVHYDQGVFAPFDQLAVLRVGSGFVVAEAPKTQLVIQQLDEVGNITHQLTQAVAPYLQPSMLFQHGHLYVAFVEEPHTDAPNRVLLSRFSCAR